MLHQKFFWKFLVGSRDHLTANRLSDTFSISSFTPKKPLRFIFVIEYHLKAFFIQTTFFRSNKPVTVNYCCWKKFCVHNLWTFWLFHLSIKFLSLSLRFENKPERPKAVVYSSAKFHYNLHRPSHTNMMLFLSEVRDSKNILSFVPMNKSFEIA